MATISPSERWPIPMLRGFWPDWKPTDAQAEAVVGRFAGIADAVAMKAAAERVYLRGHSLRPKLDDVLAEYGGAVKSKWLRAPDERLGMPTPAELEQDRREAVAGLSELAPEELAQERLRARARGLPIGPDLPPNDMRQQAACWLFASSRTPSPDPSPWGGYARAGACGAEAKGERTPRFPDCQSPAGGSPAGECIGQDVASAMVPPPRPCGAGIGTMPEGIADAEYERQLGGWGDD